ncbi:hypothetical protein [Cystobacter ferrugineus]|uniref:hypothetical protein n=1 Tax=Cystobacter ferrugineus TaxID=83449 RepID=UPI0016517E58|nr:hypothetical protein [Cystobacter ferrugineus]
MTRFKALAGVYETGKRDNAYHTFTVGVLELDTAANTFSTRVSSPYERGGAARVKTVSGPRGCALSCRAEQPGPSCVREPPTSRAPLAKETT